MSGCRQLEVRSEDRTPQKWCVPMTEDVFGTLISKGSPMAHTVFGDGSLFSPLLFGKFFDPSDAFPLWEFESSVLLSRLRSCNQSTVDWSQTDVDYVLKAELPGVGKSSVQIYVEDGKVVEISGQWKQQNESKTKDWRSGHWWENGYVRRLELPDNADWRKVEAYVKNEIALEVRIPKKPLDCGKTQGHDGATVEDYE
ncbi:21.7 kDa class VI heat shock protein-like [Camellia sinensis]|uniref:21.7 kDa class VI heat shock protein-like n=1 Tax=Camellia sinensis TaxID=4442 RepID=UPI001035A0AF|nr:21.7 kDa class VI heat shock protein-like [Camellia sinensis]